MKTLFIPGCGDTEEKLATYTNRVATAMQHYREGDCIILAGTPKEQQSAKLALNSKLISVQGKNTYEELRAIQNKLQTIDDLVIVTEGPHIPVVKYAAMLMFGNASYIKVQDNKTRKQKLAYIAREIMSFPVTALRFTGFSFEKVKDFYKKRRFRLEWN